MNDAVTTLRAGAPMAVAIRRITTVQAAVGLTLLALCVRLVGLTARPLWLDEAFSGWFAGRSWHYLWAVVPTFEAHPPFYYSLLKSWLALWGDSAVGLRSLSVLLGVLTVPLIMAAAHEQEAQEPTRRPLLRVAMAGFLAGFAPMLIAVDQEARPYPLLIFGYSLAIFGLLRLLREFRAATPGKWTSWLLLAVGTELTLWAHALGILYALCLAGALAPAWLQRPVAKDRLARGGIAGIAVAAAYLPCLFLMVGRAHDWGMNWLSWNWGKLLQLVTLYSIPVDVMTVGAAVAAITMLVLIKRAVEQAISRRGWHSERALIVMWFGPPLLAALISALFVPVFLERTLTASLVPAYLAMAGALARTDAAPERRLLVAALCLTLVPTALQTALRPATEQWDEVAAYLGHSVAPQDQVWLYPTDSALALERTGQPIPAPVRLIPAPFPTIGVHGPIRAGWPAVVSVTPGQARQLASDPALKRVPTIWLVTRQSFIFDPQADLPRALAGERRAGKPQRWGYIVVQPFTRG